MKPEHTHAYTQLMSVVESEATIAAKKKKIEKFKVEKEIKKIDAEEQLTASVSSFSFEPTPLDTSHFARLSAAKNNLQTFISEEFSDIPLYPGQLLLIGAQSGEGKSTTAANIALTAIREGKRVLFISNEERREDVIGRIAALDSGLNYSRILREFTEHDLARLNTAAAKVNQKIKVIDPSELDGRFTQTVEGLEELFAKLATTEVRFDLIIVDYYQRFADSISGSDNSFANLSRAAKCLDNAKNTYPAPIVVFSQLKNSSEKNDETTFESRIKLCKTIFTVATLAIEIIPQRSKFQLNVVVHKRRYRDEDHRDSFFVDYWAGSLRLSEAQKIERQNFILKSETPQWGSK